MKHRYIAGIVGFSLFAAAAAQAQYAEAQDYSYVPPDEGPIFRFGLGPTFYRDGELTRFATPGVPPSGPVPSPVTYDTGFTAEAALGWAFNKYAALDFETGLSDVRIDSVPGYFPNDSRIYTVPFLVNFTLSLPIPRTILVPYIGAGIGGADVVFDSDNFNDGVDGVVGSENDVVFAGQAFAGLRFKFSRHASFDLGYKFFATDRPTVSYPPDNFKVGFSGLRASSVMFAFRFDF